MDCGGEGGGKTFKHAANFSKHFGRERKSEQSDISASDGSEIKTSPVAKFDPVNW